MRTIVRSKRTRTIVTAVAGLALLGGAFYGGRVYQNNIDQGLFTAYNPPQTTRGAGTGSGASYGGGGSYGGGYGGSAQNPQVAAALSVGSPPSSGSAAGSQGSTASSGSGTTSQGTTASGGSSGLAATGSGVRPLSGLLMSQSGGTLTVQSFQGQQTVATTAHTAYYRVAAATTSALAKGDRVAVSLVAGTTTARSVTIAPSGVPYITVRASRLGGSAGAAGGSSGSGGSGFGAGSAGGSSGSGGSGFGTSGSGGSGSGSGFGTSGSGGSGSGSGFGTSGSGGSSNSGGSGFGSGAAGSGAGGSGSGTVGGSSGYGGGSGFARVAPVTGVITNLGSSSLTVKTAQGATQTITLSASTAVYRASTATSGQLATGSYVSILPSTQGGQTVAAAVAQATGATASFVPQA